MRVETQASACFLSIRGGRTEGGQLLRDPLYRDREGCVRPGTHPKASAMSDRPIESHGGSRVPVIRTAGGLVRRLGRALLWVLVVVLLVRGLASVLEPREPAAVVQAPRPASTWPDDDARAFAADFARAYLSYSPKRADVWARAVQAFASAELASSIAPVYAQDAPRQVVGSVTVARTARLDARHALVTVAASLEGAPGTQFLTVPVARDDAGGLVVSDLPSFVAGPGRASLQQRATEPLAVSERAAITPVVERFLRAYLAGDASGLEYLVPAGMRIPVAARDQQLVEVGELALAAPASGPERLVLAAVRARDAASGGVFSLRYRLRLVRRDRWYVAAVNNASRTGG